MPDLALTEPTNDFADVFDSLVTSQKSAPLAADLAGPAVVQFDANGEFKLASAANAAGARGLFFTQTARQKGQAVDGLKAVKIDGYDLESLAFGDTVYLSDTPGRLSTTAGTVSTPVAHVVPGHSSRVGEPAKKLLQFDVTRA